MPERRPEDAAPSPPRLAADPARPEGEAAPGDGPAKGAPAAGPDAGSTPKRSTAKKQPGQDNPPEPKPEARRPSGAERFAAALASNKRGASKTDTPGPSADQKPASKAAAQKPAGAPKAAGQQRTATPRRVRRARLRLTHIDPWSVMKTSFLLSVAIGIVTVVAVAIVWALLGAAGLWDSIDSAIGDVLGQTSEGFRIEDYVGMSRVMGFTMIVAVVDVVLITVIATLAAFLYNLAAALLGGIEVVLAEDDR